MDFSAELKRHTDRIEAAVDRCLPAGDARPGRLHAAMRYSMQAGGKRLRPVLVAAAAERFDPEARTDPLPAAVAVECVHTYSLIHDDLPCMDNDDLRRGRPTAHKAFDEATALLAGDALLTEAFALIATSYAARPALAHALVRELADAAGSRRLVGGQMADLLAEKQETASAEELEFIHLNKTAAMIEASLVIGGLCGGGREQDIAGLRRAGRALGMAFQIVDDILDGTAETSALGKTAGKDARAGKMTFMRLHGLEDSRRFVRDYTDRATAELRRLPGASTFLSDLAESMALRVR
jgi:geranylgeranyl pyrophosphate synthase